MCQVSNKKRKEKKSIHYMKTWRNGHVFRLMHTLLVIFISGLRIFLMLINIKYCHIISSTKLILNSFLAITGLYSNIFDIHQCRSSNYKLFVLQMIWLCRTYIMCRSNHIRGYMQPSWCFQRLVHTMWAYDWRWFWCGTCICTQGIFFSLIFWNIATGNFSWLPIFHRERDDDDFYLFRT